jgi:hypothetical protein
VDDLLRLGALTIMLMLTSFGLGAMVMWSLESRRPRVPPLWLVVLKWLMLIGWAAYGFVGHGAPTGIVAIDPLWWTLLGIVAIGAGVLGLVIEVRTILSGGSRDAA